MARIETMQGAAPIEPVVEFLFEHMGTYVEDRAIVSTNVGRCLAEGAVLVASEGRDIAAVLCARRGATIAEVELVYIAVDPAQRRQGIADALLEAIQRVLPAESYCAHVDPTNRGVLAHHARLGFRQRYVALVVDGKTLQSSLKNFRKLSLSDASDG